LLNVLTKAALESRDEVLLVESVRAALASSSDQLQPQAGFLTMAEAEKRHVEAALRLANWNVSAAARALGITRPTLRSHMLKHKISKPA
jgi:two-component system response regulator AtoC